MMVGYRMVKIPDHLYKKAKKIAQERQQPVNELITDVLDETLSFLQNNVMNETSVDLSEPDEDVDREMEAYIALHPTLWQKYPGQHVAIYKGELIDRDTDLNNLYSRIDEHFPDQFVWITTVKAEPIEIVRTTSFRLTPIK